MEKRDLYDINRKPTGKTIYKGEEVPKDNFILVVVIFIQNSKSEFLIQKRSPKKGGTWAFTGGHPKSGETSIQGIITEVKEELGIDIKNPVLFKQAGNKKDKICDLYYLIEDIDIKDIKLQKEEVTDVKYVTIEEIDELYQKNEFKKGHYMMLKDYLDYKKFR